MVAKFRALARRDAVVASTRSGTGPAGADVGSRAPRHWRHAGRTRGGNQQAALARIAPASRFAHGPLGGPWPSNFETELERDNARRSGARRPLCRRLERTQRD